jgi:hypothetical protein
MMAILTPMAGSSFPRNQTFRVGGDSAVPFRGEYKVHNSNDDPLPLPLAAVPQPLPGESPLPHDWNFDAGPIANPGTYEISLHIPKNNPYTVVIQIT